MATQGDTSSLALVFLIFAILIFAMFGWCILSSCVGSSILTSFSGLWEASVMSSKINGGGSARRRRQLLDEGELLEMEYRGRGRGP